MRTVDLRIALEQSGARLSVQDGKLVVVEPTAGLPAELRRELRHAEAALVTLVSLFPCGGTCGLEPFTGRCEPCPKRPNTWRGIRSRRDRP